VKKDLCLPAFAYLRSPLPLGQPTIFMSLVTLAAHASGIALLASLVMRRTSLPCVAAAVARFEEVLVYKS